MTPRRNPFEPAALVSPGTPATDLYETLRVASPRQRSRQWEKEHLSHKVVYRGVDPTLALSVRSLAADLQVPGGEVARALIECALRAYARGDLNLDPRPNPQRLRMTLFPTADSPALSPATIPSRRKSVQTSWRVIVTWRGFPPELKQELAALAGEEGLNVPLGELITALLRFGLQAHQIGLLPLTPTPKTTSFTLDGKRQK